ncbi:type VII secretion-associated serine protease mycosin [Kitasatospora sp. NPDC004289]
MRGRQVSFVGYRKAAAAFVALGVVGGLAATPAQAEQTGEHWSPLGIAASAECSFPSNNVESTPWSIQRLLLDQLWGSDAKPDANGKKVELNGSGVKVAVIDTGVDDTNPQLQGKVDEGLFTLFDKSANKKPDGNAKTDPVGHGTKVAGIIAARKVPGTGFVGIAPGASIVSYRQNDAQGNGDVKTLIDSINDAIGRGVDVINISQDVRATNEKGDFDHSEELKAAVNAAEQRNIVVVASAGNDGHEIPTYPAAYETVLAVGASDRNNERAGFSQYGEFVDVAAPGVDMLSTVPKGGQCVDNGTSFSTPYVAGVAALLKQRHKDWTARQIRARIMQTAQRTERSSNRFVGWGVVDPVKAVRSTAPPAEAPEDDPPVMLAQEPLSAQPAGLVETQSDRDARTATYVLGLGGLLVGGLAGGSVVLRDRRRREDPDAM